MKIMALVLFAIVLGLGLVVLPTLGSPSFSLFGGAAQYTAGDGKNNSGSALDGNNTTPTVMEAQGSGVYRSLSQTPAGPYALPGAILAIGVAVAAAAYLLIRRSVP